MPQHGNKVRTIERTLFRLYWDLEKRIVPGNQYSQTSYEHKLTRVLQPGNVWLDLGCGKRVLPPWREQEERGLAQRPGYLVGIDPELKALQANTTVHQAVCGVAETLPFRDERFDIVTANMVVEHLRDPVSQFREVRRVLRPGGIFVFHTPNAAGYQVRLARRVPERLKAPIVRVLEGRVSDDIFKTHYRANTREQIVAAAASAQLQVAELDFISTTAVFVRVLPLAMAELLILRRLMREEHSDKRPNIIATLRRPL